MSCDAAALSVHLWLAAVHRDPAAESARLLRTVAAVEQPLHPLAREPLYADIVARARALKRQVEAYRKAGGATPGFDGFKGKVAELSALDMKGHLDLAKRGTDGDLKCILKGISQDLPKKLDELAAATGPAREKALADMSYLLNDNVEVITAPPKPPV
jgi:hypothetical protein